jgi:hypothetical protein
MEASMLKLVMINTLIVVLVCGLVAPGALAQETENAEQTKEDRIRHMLELSKTREQGYQGALLMFEQFQKIATDVPEGFWDEILDILVENLDEFVEMLIPIYDRHFSAEDIEALIAFYESPVGQRYIEKQGTVQQEAMIAGQRWGEQMAEVVLERLESQKQAAKEAEQADQDEPASTETPADKTE